MGRSKWSADPKLNYHCGCGWASDDFDEAVGHCKESGHCLTVNGTIKAVKETPEQAQ